jgi:hypothetical protein
MHTKNGKRGLGWFCVRRGRTAGRLSTAPRIPLWNDLAVADNRPPTRTPPSPPLLGWLDQYASPEAQLQAQARCWRC